MGNCTNEQRFDRLNHNLEKQNNHNLSQGQYSELLCSHSHQIVYMCINRNCHHDALYCADSKCSAVHSKCAHVKLAQIMQLIQKRLKDNQQFIFDMENVEKDMIQAVRERMKVHLSKVMSQEVDKRYGELVDAVYYKKIECSFQGSQAEEFCMKLRQSDQRRGEIQKNMLVEFRKEVQQISKALNKVESEIIGSYIRQSKITFQNGSKNLQQLQEKNQKYQTDIEQSKEEIYMNSIILPSQKTKQLKLIMDSLNQPKSLELIFRASQHAFRASAFHHFCDDIPNTLTIIQTQYGKTIVGFTPLTWNCTKGFAIDETGKSFLLSLNLGKKLSLLRPEKTIQCIPTYGPVFGGGSDIAICDQCHIINKSCTNFPYSYNHADKYTYGQQSWQALCGVKQGKYFNIIEYQVFKVKW